MEKYYLVGIGGSGMSALAQVLAHGGIEVCGSDRGYDQGENSVLFSKLKGLGVKLYPQDGSGTNSGIDKMIISRAIENDNPDIIVAQKLKIPIVYRQDELKKIFRENSGIAVAGTSGKSTVVGMISCILPRINIINGGIIKNYETKDMIGNVRFGKDSCFCVETDESEGDLSGYFPKIGVITNIGKDHMDQKETIKVYEEFKKEVTGKLIEDISLRQCRDIKLFPSYSLFKMERQKYRLNIPGVHNIYNAVAAIKASRAFGADVEEIKKGLENFKGIKRRFELVAHKKGVRVIDDYAHNPDKIKAALCTAKLGKGRVIAVYQPHGFGPLRMFLNELSCVFSKNIRKCDFTFISDVYYAGGSVNKDISSEDLVKKINKTNVRYVPNRQDILNQIKRITKSGDTILVMGARDVTLSDLAKKIAKEI
jgi:UDP-N-acetylmuramate--alanine ligase